MATKKKLGPQSPICHKCIGESELQRRIRSTGTIQICDQCHKRTECILLSALADTIGEVFENFYEPGDDVPVMEENHDSPRWDQEGDPPDQIIAELIDAEREVVEAIVEYLSSQEIYSVIKDAETAYYDIGTNYVQTDLNTHRHFRIWNEFRDRIKHTQRFFDEESIKLLREIFGGIEDFSFGGGQVPITIVDPKNSKLMIYRSRRASSGQNAIEILNNPSLELGPPPADKAKAGRMNPAGIPVFYGALDITTCIAELRPSVGSLIVRGAFRFTSKVKLLDLSVYEKKIKPPSIFQQGAYDGLTRWKFLRSFHRQIVRPVQPEDEPFEYVPTQAVAEYIANVLKYDGVIYSSAQAGRNRRNIALFKVAVSSGKSEKKGKSPVDNFVANEEPDEKRLILEYVPGSARVERVSKAEYTRYAIEEEDLLLY